MNSELVWGGAARLQQYVVYPSFLGKRDTYVHTVSAVEVIAWIAPLHGWMEIDASDHQSVLRGRPLALAVMTD